MNALQDRLSLSKPRKAHLMAVKRFSESLVDQLKQRRHSKPTLTQADKTATLRRLHTSLEMDIGEEDVLRWRLYDVSTMEYLYAR